MLVLSRKLSEEICIGDAITVKVMSINGNRVKLGLNAPQEVPIHRLEVVTAIDGCEAESDRELACSEYL